MIIIMHVSASHLRNNMSLTAIQCVLIEKTTQNVYHYKFHHTHLHTSGLLHYYHLSQA